MVPEDAIQDSKGRKQLIILPSRDTYEPHQRLEWHDNPKDAHTSAATNSSLVELKICSTRGIHALENELTNQC